MNTVELIVEGRQLDTYENTVIPLVFQFQNFNEFNDKVGSFSRSFVIPRTDNNNDILNNIYTFNIKNNIAYTTLDAILKVNGVEIGRGNAIVENDGITQSSIRLTFYFDASPFYQLASATKLHNCNWNSFDHYYSHIRVQEGLDSDLDYVYPIIDYGNKVQDFNSTINTTKTSLHSSFPAIKFSAIIKAIEKTTGYKFKGSLLSKNYFTNAVVPYSKGTFQRCSAYENRYNFTTRYTQSQPITDYLDVAYRINPFGNILDADSNSIVPYKEFQLGGNKVFMFPDTVRLNLNLRATIIIVGVTNLSFFFQGQSSTFISNIATIKNNATGVVTTGVLNLFNNSMNFTSVAAGEYTFEANMEVILVAHWQREFHLSSNIGGNTIKDLVLKSIFIANEGTTEDDKLISYVAPETIYDWAAGIQYFTGSPNNIGRGDYVLRSGVLYYAINDNINSAPPSSDWITAFGGYISRFGYSIVTAGSLLPDITVGAWLKYMCQLYTCIIIANENTKEVELYTLDDLFKNLGNQVDWTNKLVNIENASWNTRPSNYGQKSICKFNNEEKNGDVGQGSFLINDTTLPENQTVISFPLAASKNVIRYTNLPVPIELQYIKRINEQYEYGGEDKITIGYIETYQGNLGTLSYLTKDGAIKYTRTTNQKVSVFKYLGYDYSLINYNNKYPYIFKEFKELNCEIMLTESDIANRNCRNPIYLEQFSSLFFLQKIDNWVQGKPTKVELLKLV